jgi:hypothetical protein
MRVLDMIRRFWYYKNTESKDICIPYKEWKYNEDGDPIGKNGKPRFMNMRTAELIPDIVYVYLEDEFKELLDEIHQHSIGEGVYENFDTNAPIYRFFLSEKKEVKQLQNKVKDIRIPFSWWDGQDCPIEIEIEYRPKL